PRTSRPSSRPRRIPSNSLLQSRAVAQAAVPETLPSGFPRHLVTVCYLGKTARLDNRREHDEDRQGRREPDRDEASAPAPAVHAADADDEQDRAPREREIDEVAEDPVSGPVVVAAGPEEVLAVDHDSHRPDG